MNRITPEMILSYAIAGFFGYWALHGGGVQI